MISRRFEIPYDRADCSFARHARRKRVPMKTIPSRKFIAVVALLVICPLLTVAAARADEIKVVTSGGFTAAYLELVPEYESSTHNKLVTEFGPSMGTTHNAIPVRL